MEDDRGGPFVGQEPPFRPPISEYRNGGRLFSFNDGDLGGGEAVELVDEGIDGVIGGGDVALDQVLTPLK